jgi:hypothetical protein
VTDSLEHTFAGVTLDRRPAAHRFARRLTRPKEPRRDQRRRSSGEPQLQRWIAARIQNFAGVNMLDLTHKLIDELGRDFIIRHGKMKNH